MTSSPESLCFVILQVLCRPQLCLLLVILWAPFSTPQLAFEPIHASLLPVTNSDFFLGVSVLYHLADPLQIKATLLLWFGPSGLAAVGPPAVGPAAVVRLLWFGSCWYSCCRSGRCWSRCCGLAPVVRLLLVPLLSVRPLLVPLLRFGWSNPAAVHPAASVGLPWSGCHGSARLLPLLLLVPGPLKG